VFEENGMCAPERRDRSSALQALALDHGRQCVEPFTCFNRIAVVVVGSKGLIG
jgi:hypothetical protein